MSKPTATGSYVNPATDPSLFAAFERIACDCVPGLETLVTRNSDGLDFHDVSVEALVRMMSEAYRLGTQRVL